MQSEEYLFYNAQIGKHNGSLVTALQYMKCQSHLLYSRLVNGMSSPDGKIHVRGRAYSGGARWPERVEVSPDGGFTWYVKGTEDARGKISSFDWLDPHANALQNPQFNIRFHCYRPAEYTTKPWNNDMALDGLVSKIVFAILRSTRPC